MLRRTLLALPVCLSGLSPAAATARTLLDVDFDDASGNAPYTFSEGDLPAFTSSNTAEGNPGRAASFEVTGVDGQPGYAAGSLERDGEGRSGLIDFGRMLGKPAAGLVGADFARLSLRFDVLTSVGAGANAARLMPDDDYAHRLEFTADYDTRGSFTGSGDFELASATNFAAFLTALRASGGVARFQISLTPGPDRTFRVGDTVMLDNLRITGGDAPGGAPAEPG